MIRVGRYLRTQGIRDVGARSRADPPRHGSSRCPAPSSTSATPSTVGTSSDGLADRAFQGDWAPPGTGLPVMLVSLGTAYNVRADFYRMIIESAHERPWHVVLAIGDQVDAEDLGSVPDNVEVLQQVPQLAVLRQARAFVTHAGMGGTMEALHEGVPLVAVPQTAEQRANADRIAELRLGMASTRSTSMPMSSGLG